MPLFSELNLTSPLARALDEVSYTEMTPVQAASLPMILSGRDVTARAKTGSGKTAAFALGLLTAIDPRASNLQGLVLCPTRELADQVSREIRRLAAFTPNVKVLALYGGVPVRLHLNSLVHEPHLVVGTPGRILDLLRKNALSLQALKVLVLDEADRMLDMGFADDILDIVGRCPVPRQTLLFSATMPDAIRRFARPLQHESLDIDVEDADDVSVEQKFFNVEEHDKATALASLLLSYRPDSAVVFCNTRDRVRTVAEALSNRGFSVLALHGELEQQSREEMLVGFANGSSNILVASDVAARGLDIKNLPMVINFEIATDTDTHLHRIGRTGRAGSRGLALNLCTLGETSRAIAIAEQGGRRLHWTDLPAISAAVVPLPAPFATLLIQAGRQDKLRPGDVLGALTGDMGVPGTAVGKIDVFPTRTYVATTREWTDRALQGLRIGTIKGRSFRVRKAIR